jgi:hypothetical protein
MIAAAAGAVLLVRRACMRPRAWGVAVGVLAAAPAVVPFLANGRVGTLGWSFDNDISIHLLWADAYRSQAIEAINALPPSYPLGPHALVGTFAQGLGIGVDYTFTGYEIAIVVITAWTTLAVLDRVSWWGKAVVAIVTANVFLLASYYGEASFFIAYR